jgi:hypothetical protein
MIVKTLRSAAFLHRDDAVVQEIGGGDRRLAVIELGETTLA